MKLPQRLLTVHSEPGRFDPPTPVVSPTPPDAAVCGDRINHRSNTPIKQRRQKRGETFQFPARRKWTHVHRAHPPPSRAALCRRIVLAARLRLGVPGVRSMPFIKKKKRVARFWQQRRPWRAALLPSRAGSARRLHATRSSASRLDLSVRGGQL